MRSPIATLSATLLVIAAALITAVGALGIALIGALLSRWFELTQWQGSLLALGVLLAVALLLYRLLESDRYTDEPEWLSLDEAELETPAEPPIVAWRRERPTQGQPPAQTGKKPKS